MFIAYQLQLTNLKCNPLFQPERLACGLHCPDVQSWCCCFKAWCRIKLRSDWIWSQVHSPNTRPVTENLLTIWSKIPQSVSAQNPSDRITRKTAIATCICNNWSEHNHTEADLFWSSSTGASWLLITSYQEVLSSPSWLSCRAGKSRRTVKSGEWSIMNKGR